MGTLVEHPEVHSLSFDTMTFRHPNQAPLFDSIDFDFPLGKFVQIRGHQGSGVTSLLRILAATQPPTSGHYRINGFSVHELTLTEFRPYQTSIGYAFDQGGLISNRTLAQNLQLPMEFHGEMLRREASSRAEAYLKRFEIAEFRELRPALASGGTRKAACLARAFIMRPKILLLDNPTQGLNRHAIKVLVDTIRWHQKEFGLEHVFAGTEDDVFLQEFNVTAVEIGNQRLREVA